MPGGKRLDARTQGGGRATEVERSGSSQGLEAAARRLKQSGAPQKVLQVPQKDMGLVSAGYTRRPWPQYEWNIAKLEAERRQEEFILPLRVDDSLLVGLLDTVGYLDLRDLGLPRMADILIRKLEVPAVAISTVSQEQEWVVTFGLNIEDLEQVNLPAGAPSEVPMLYDWLIDDLVNRLIQGRLPRTRVIEDLRTGETLSVRLGCAWEPAKGALDFGELEW